jgi:hypothetical protein
VKLVDLEDPPRVTSSITIDETPWGLAILPDGLIVGTTLDKVIYLFTVAADKLVVSSRIETEMLYFGVAPHPDGSLIVSCLRDDNNGVARVDTISRDGSVLRTLTDNTQLTQLSRLCICMLLLTTSFCQTSTATLCSDWTSSRVSSWTPWHTLTWYIHAKSL